MLNDAELKERIHSFDRWHYEFDLGGHKTPIWSPEKAQRHRERRRYFFEPLVQMFGGSLNGKRVLDLGCNAGFWSLCAAEAGADFVLGIDARRMHVEQSQLVFEAKGIAPERHQFLCANLLDVDLESHGPFDIVLMLGLLYHLNRPVELLERLSRVGKDVLLIDTYLSKAKGSMLELHREPVSDPRNTADFDLAFHPTREAVYDLVGTFGYQARTIRPQFTDYQGSTDYRRGKRRAFVCARETPLERMPVEWDKDPAGH